MVVKAIFGLIFVIAILYLILKLVQKFGKIGITNIVSKEKTNITSIVYIDDSTKIISAVHGPTKYLFVIGKNSSLLLDKYDNYEKS